MVGVTVTVGVIVRVLVCVAVGVIVAVLVMVGVGTVGVMVAVNVARITDLCNVQHVSPDRELVPSRLKIETHACGVVLGC